MNANACKCMQMHENFRCLKCFECSKCTISWVDWIHTLHTIVFAVWKGQSVDAESLVM